MNHASESFHVISPEWAEPFLSSALQALAETAEARQLPPRVTYEYEDGVGHDGHPHDFCQQVTITGLPHPDTRDVATYAISDRMKGPEHALIISAVRARPNKLPQAVSITRWLDIHTRRERYTFRTAASAELPARLWTWLEVDNLQDTITDASAARVELGKLATSFNVELEKVLHETPRKISKRIHRNITRG